MQIVSESLQMDECQVVFGHRVSIRPSWCNTLPSLQQSCARAMRKKLDLPKGFDICNAVTLGYYDPAKTPKAPTRKAVNDATAWFLKQ